MSSDKPPTNIYTYRDLGESDIRFLCLHIGREDEPLTGDLLHFERRSTPAYQAVSYVWGDPSLSRELYLQEGILAITASLAALLRRCRSLLGCGRLTEIIFWVDAVCINQNDDQEESRQICIMKEIYARADRVLIWLRPDCDSIPDAVALGKAICSLLYHEGPRIDEEEL